MEGATDAEATSIARQAAQSCGITGTDVEAGLPCLVLADVTGTVTVGGSRPRSRWTTLMPGPWADSAARSPSGTARS